MAKQMLRSKTNANLFAAEYISVRLFFRRENKQFDSVIKQS